MRLICGPTGSGKTKRAVEAFLAALDRGEEAVFIAPSRPDARHFLRRILAIRPVLTGGDVTTFEDLYRESLSDGGGGRIISPLARSLILKGLAAGPGKPEKLAGSANFDGFFSELSRLVSELGELGVSPGQLGEGLKDWARGDTWRQGLNRDLFRLYGEYRIALDDLDACDPEMSARRAVDGLAKSPGLLGYSAVIIDGFHDFTPLELELVKALSAAAPELMVTLPCLPGRAALAAPARSLESLRDGAEVIMLEGRVSSGVNPVIDHISRELFEDEPGTVDAGGVITVLQAAGMRGQAESIAAEILRLRRQEDIQLDDIAIITRGHGPDSLAIAAALDAFGIPFELAAPVPLLHTPLGRAAAAALDLASGTGDRQSLMTFLRNVSGEGDQGKVDEFDRLARLRGSEDLAALIMEWDHSGGHPLSEVDRLAKAARQGLEALAAELLDVFRGHVRAGISRAAIDEVGLDTAALKALASVCEEAASVAGKLTDLRGGGAAIDQPDESWALGLMRDCIDGASVRLRSGARRNCVRLLDPHRVLNQKFDAVFLCSLLEGQFPSFGRDNAFLTDADRDWLRKNAGLTLATRENRLDEERFLFHRTLTRARHKAYLCYPYCDKEGKPTIRSLFVDDTLDLFEPDSWDKLDRSIGEVTFPAAAAPTPTQALLSAAAMSPGASGPAPANARLRTMAGAANLESRFERCLAGAVPNWPEIGEEVKEQLAAQEYFRVTELEAYLKCPFRYFIEKIVRPGQLEPQEAALTRGSAVHSILADFFQALKPGGIILPGGDAGRVAEARRIMAAIVAETLTDDPGIGAAIMRIELSSHLDRFVERESVMRPQFEPYQQEWSFGICDGKPAGRYDEETMLKFEDFKLCGRIDRVDLRKGTNQAIVIDYKTSLDGNLPTQAQFAKTGTIQVPLYMLALRDIWGLEAIGGEYYGILGKRRRGLYLKSFGDALGKDSAETFKNEFVEAEVFEERLETARNQALEAARGIRSGCFDCKPLDDDTCGYCKLGGICRGEAVPAMVEAGGAGND